MLDLMGAIKIEQELFRKGVRAMGPVFKIPVPETEQDWLKFRLNHNLRNLGIGKRTYYAPASEDEAARAYEQVEEIRRLAGLAANGEG